MAAGVADGAAEATAGRPSSAGPVLSLRAYSTGFDTGAGRLTVVDTIDLDVARGEVIALVGESGSGKSVVCRSFIGLAGANSWRRGSASLCGIDLMTASERDFVRLRGAKAAMIFQDPVASLDPLQSVGAHLMATLRRHFDLSPQAAQDRAIALLRQVGFPSPEERLAAYPHQLSGGMSQRVAIALALASEPDLLIADEPTTALDVTLQGQVLDLLSRLVRENGLTLILVTHDLGIVRRIADRVAILYAGRIVELAPTAALFEQPRHRYTRALLDARPNLWRPVLPRAIHGEVPSPWTRPPGCAFAPRCGHADGLCISARPDLRPVGASLTACRHPVGDRQAAPGLKPSNGETTAMSGEARRHSPEGERTPLLQIRSASRSFRIGRHAWFRRAPTITAVDDVSLQLVPGETLGLVGESGCGKTTLGRLVMGMTRLEAGSVRIGGEALTPGARIDRAALACRVQIVFQDPRAALDPRLPVAVQVAEPLRVHRRHEPAQRRTLATRLLRAVGIPSHLDDALPEELSGGQAQRVVIARALVLDPQLLVCDEPTSALDVSVQAQVIDVLANVQRDRGLALLLISHDLALVRVLARRIAVMRGGRIVEVGTAEQIVERPRHPYTRALVAACDDGDAPMPEARNAITCAPGNAAYPIAGSVHR